MSSSILFVFFCQLFGFLQSIAWHCDLIYRSGRIPGTFQRLAEWTSKCQPETFQLLIYCSMYTFNTLN